MAFNKKQGFAKKLVVVVIVAIVIIIAGALMLNGTPTVSSLTTVSIIRNSSYNFYLPGASDLFSIYLIYSSPSSTTLYFGQAPILNNNIGVVQLGEGQSANISLNGDSNADLQISVIASSLKSATLSLSYIPSTIGIRQSSIVKSLNNFNSSYQQTQTSIQTTVAQQSNTQQQTSTTTVAVTTIPQETASQLAITAANQTYLGKLMSGYNQIYVREASLCTPSAYNTSFLEANHYPPSGPYTYSNASVVVPRYITANATLVSGDTYNATYTAASLSGKSTILVFTFNNNTKAVTSYTFKGDFLDLSYNEALQQYQSMNLSSGGDCSAYIP